MTDIEKLKALIDAGEKATEGTWWFDNTGITVSPPNGGNFGISFRDNANGVFVVSAANSREALSNTISYVEKLEEALREIADHTPCTATRKIAEQALEKG